MTAETKPSIEISNPMSKAVVIMFPDERTTGGPDKKLLSRYTPTLAKQFRLTTEKLLERYKRNGFKTIAVVYGDTNKENFSWYYPEDSFDLIVKLSFGIEQWQQQRYQEELPNIINNLNFSSEAEVIVGGWHARDCVNTAVRMLRDHGLKTTVDLRLTDQLPFLLISHRVRRMLPNNLRNETAVENNIIWERFKAETG